MATFNIVNHSGHVVYGMDLGRLNTETKGLYPTQGTGVCLCCAFL
jgi:hypothetical protein